MPRDRKEVEEYYTREKQEEEEKTLAVRTTILNILENDPENIYSFREITNLFGTLPPDPAPGTTEQPQPIPGEINQQDFQRIQNVVNTLVQEQVVVVYRWPANPGPQDHPADFHWLGVNREEASTA